MKYRREVFACVARYIARSDETVVAEWRKSPSISCQWRFSRSADARVREFWGRELRVSCLLGRIHSELCNLNGTRKVDKVLPVSVGKEPWFSETLG